jgi:hypothetical protein
MSMTRETYVSIRKKKERNTTVKAAEIPVHTHIYLYYYHFFPTPLLPSTIRRFCPRLVIRKTVFLTNLYK